MLIETRGTKKGGTERARYRASPAIKTDFKVEKCPGTQGEQRKNRGKNQREGGLASRRVRV